MKNINNYQGQEVRNSTNNDFAIFFEGKELETDKSGSKNSNGGIVLAATLPTGENIKWRSNDRYGKKGFSFDDIDNESYSTENNHKAEDDTVINKITSELRSKLEYKIINI